MIRNSDGIRVKHPAVNNADGIKTCVLPRTKVNNTTLRVYTMTDIVAQTMDQKYSPEKRLNVVYPIAMT